jgi:hypothetical protein
MKKLLKNKKFVITISAILTVIILLTGSFLMLFFYQFSLPKNIPFGISDDNRYGRSLIENRELYNELIDTYMDKDVLFSPEWNWLLNYEPGYAEYIFDVYDKKFFAHQIGGKVFAKPEFYEWLFNQKREH